MGGFADYYGQTIVHPLGLAILLALGFAVLLVRRQYALIPFLLLACLIPSAQRIVVVTLDFSFMRILTIFGMIRILMNQEYRDICWNRLDSCIAAWVASCTVVMTVQLGTFAALVNRLGWGLDMLGMYVVFRALIRDWADVLSLLRAVALLSLPVAGFFLVERTTGRNMFSVFGGVPEVTRIRDGRLRCQGPFSHAILAGAFWACLIPWIVGYGATSRMARLLAAAAIVACLVIIVACASSTPLLSFAAAVAGIACFKLRNRMSAVRWGIVAMLIALHLLMAKPVWHLMARADLVGGSTGWHRYVIFDAFVNHFDKWWLLGEPNPLSWGVWQMRDITNQYMLEGLRGGLISLAFFCAAWVLGFVYSGRAIRQTRGQAERFVTWCLGVGLFCHVITFWGVSYFGQINMLPMLSLAVAANLPAIIARKNQEASAIAVQRRPVRSVETSLGSRLPTGDQVPVPSRSIPAGFS